MATSKLHRPGRIPDLDYGSSITQAVVQMAGQPSFVEDLRTELCNHGVTEAVERYRTGPIFDWLVATLSYQGISDAVAYGYMQRHGRATWSKVREGLRGPLPCPKLKSYWNFEGCGFNKTSGTCAEPDHYDRCPLPALPLRNGRLNQTAYSLFLFIRDIAGGDIIGWIDERIEQSTASAGLDRLRKARAALIIPLRHVFGVSDKVLGMAMSALLIGAGERHKGWFDVGASFVVVDTLVHNFLHRTGLIRRLGSQHPYGPACYQPAGCAEILYRLANAIDARLFNSQFPQVFPRFVQHAVWRYCAEGGLDICNGNRLDDGGRCGNVYCRLYRLCDRVALRQSAKYAKSGLFQPY